MSSEERYEEIKEAVLIHIQSLFEEMEQEMAMSHQEKYALLEDSFESATDEDELRVAFERWYADHAEDLKLDYEVGELWDNALNGELSCDNYNRDKDDEEDDEEDSNFSNFNDDEEEDF